VKAVIHVATVVPAKDVIPLTVAKTVFAENVLVNSVHFLYLQGAELAVEFVKHPSDGSFGNQAGRNDPIANFIVDEAQFGPGNDHINPLIFENRTETVGLLQAV
jgi:hypothetical protein